MALAAMVLGSARAAAPALNGFMDTRSLTPQEIKDYALPGLAPASGLNTTGTGQPFYLDALVSIAIPPSSIASVTWTLTSKPLASRAALANSPLGPSIPPYREADRRVFQVAGRAMLQPDVAGQYVVSVFIVADNGSGSTNLNKALTAGTYMGAQTCALCHSGGSIAQTVYPSWTNTPHARAFEKAINGISTDHFSQNCIVCHVVGYDTNSAAANGGFDDLAAQTGWTFPSTISSNNWAVMPSALKSVANIQCENCHGPGSEHVYAMAKTNVSNWPRLGVSMGAGNCAQCHDSLSHHYRTAEWKASRHAIATRVPSGSTRSACVRCHTAAGFVQHMEKDYASGTNTTYEAITCQICHDPHDARHAHQLRAGPSYTLADGTVVPNAGASGVCFECHHARNGAAETNIVNYQKGLPTWAGGSSFGVHDSPQGDMVAGANAITYGLSIPGSAHGAAVADLCVGCHMQPVDAADPAFTHAGGHTFRMTHDVVTDGVTNTMDLTGACVKCHGPVASFDMPRADYDGDGVTEGVQSEVRHLLDRLSTLLPNSSGVVDGLVKSSIFVRTNWSTEHLQGAYNWQFVKNDGSFGIHNAPYAVGLLKASIGDLTGDANSDGLPDSWQVQYFGSATNSNAAPEAAPSGDGVPNWLKFQLGLNPLVPGKTLPGGVLWENAASVGNADDLLRIYTAAEIVFPTEAGRGYQVQSISPGSGWSNVGAVVTGTGDPMTFSVPTRSNAQQYFRVVTTN